MKKIFNNEDIILNAKQVSEYLHIPLRTIHYLSKQGKIRSVKIGKHWRYLKSDFDEYFSFGTLFSKEPARKPNNFIERRTCQRINTNLKCRYSINLTPYKQIMNEGIVKNLSAGGILLDNRKEQTDKINIDDPIDLKFLLILDNKQRIDISAKGKIVRKAQDGIGIKFKSIDREVQNRIKEYAE